VSRFPLGHVGAALVWVALMAAVYVVVDRGSAPTVAVAVEAGGEIVIPRSRDGHYYVAGEIDGHPLTFMVDTGASIVSLDEASARAAGLPRGRATRFVTAGGPVVGEEVGPVTVSVGPYAVAGLRVGVLPSSSSHALLGQNFLRRFEVTQAGDRMVLRSKSAG
jgi:aspartyl protease family protein